MFEDFKLKIKQWNEIIHAVLRPVEPGDYSKWYNFALEIWREDNGYTKENYSRWKKVKSIFFTNPLHYPPRPSCNYYFLNELPQADEGKYMYNVTKLLKEERGPDSPYNKFTSATSYEILTSHEILRLEAYYRTYCPDYIPEEEVFHGIPN